jgi:hypothetical protein
MGKMSKPPKHYLKFKKLYPSLFAAWEAIGKSVRDARAQRNHAGRVG